MDLKSVDQLNNELLFSSFPKRIISLVPSISELIAHYEPHIELIGVTKFCEHPQNLRTSKNIIGGTKDPNLEKIIALKPDLIIANKEENRKEDIDFLKQSIPVWVSDVANLADASQMIERLEKLLQVPSINQVYQIVQKHIKKSPGTIKGTVAYVIWKSPIMIAGNDTFISSWLNHIGLKNITDATRYPEVTIEWLSDQRPDYIFLSSEPYPFKEKNQLEIQSICKDSKVILVDGRIFSWYGRAIIDAHPYLSKLISTLTA